jgi:hypothetical protein
MFYQKRLMKVLFYMRRITPVTAVFPGKMDTSKTPPAWLPAGGKPLTLLRSKRPQGTFLEVSNS